MTEFVYQLFNTMLYAFKVQGSGFRIFNALVSGRWLPVAGHTLGRAVIKKQLDFSENCFLASES
jgi:hypothetical protein